MKVIGKFLVLLCGPFLLAQNVAQLDSLLVEGINARSNKEYSTSLAFLTKVRTVAEENHWYKQQFLALNNIGANYYSMLDYGEALDNYLEAYTIALKHLDENEEMIVLNNIAILYSKEGDLVKAEEYFSKAYVLAKERNEQVKIGLYAVNLGIVANQQDKIERAASYLAEAKEMLKNEPSLAILVEIALAENHYKRGDLSTAKTLAERILPELETIAFSEERISVLVLLSNVANDMGETTEAVAYAQAALNAAVNPENRINAYRQLSEVYTKNAFYDKALAAKDSVISLTDSLNQLKTADCLKPIALNLR